MLVTERAKLCPDTGHDDASRPLTIAQIGSADHGGGAAAVASALMRGYLSRGHRVTHFVGSQRRDDPNVVQLADDDRWPFRVSGYTPLQKALRRIGGRYPARGFGLIGRSLRNLTHPHAVVARQRGFEDFEFPASRRLAAELDGAFDVVHAHNLHGSYFDLRALDDISHRLPTLITMHDMWLMTGHCAYSLGCDRWQTGCGACPDLKLDPPIARDATRENWQRKRDVYSRSRLHLVTPSRWLRQQVGASLLEPQAASIRVIPYGVDTSVFNPVGRAAVRSALGLSPDVFVVLLTVGSRGSMWKDDKTLRRVASRLAEARLPRPVEFVAVGRESAIAPNGRVKTWSTPFQHDPRVMADYYRAADVYVHAAHADTFPLAVLEALACGTPVVATDVGGISEQIDQATGVLVPAADCAAMAAAVAWLLDRDEVRSRMGRDAVAAVESQFTLDRQVDAYLAMYAELLDRRPASRNQLVNA